MLSCLQVRQELPELKFAEMNKELGNRWRNADAAVKGKYQKMAGKDKQRFLKEQAAWEGKKPASTNGGTTNGGTKKAASAAKANNKAESVMVDLKDAESAAEELKKKIAPKAFETFAKEMSKNLGNSK